MKSPEEIARNTRLLIREKLGRGSSDSSVDSIMDETIAKAIQAERDHGQPCEQDGCRILVNSRNIWDHRKFHELSKEVERLKNMGYIGLRSENQKLLRDIENLTEAVKITSMDFAKSELRYNELRKENERLMGENKIVGLASIAEKGENLKLRSEVERLKKHLGGIKHDCVYDTTKIDSPSCFICGWFELRFKVENLRNAIKESSNALEDYHNGVLIRSKDIDRLLAKLKPLIK